MDFQKYYLLPFPQQPGVSWKNFGPMNVRLAFSLRNRSLGSNSWVLPLPSILEYCWRKNKTVTLNCHAMLEVRRRFLDVGVALFRNPCTVRDTAKIFYRSMSMKALVIEEFGDSSKLKYTEVTKPEPGDGEVI